MQATGTGTKQEGRGLGALRAFLVRAFLILFISLSIGSNFADPTSQLSFASDIEDTQRLALAGGDGEPDPDQPDLVFVIRATAAAQYMRAQSVVAQFVELPSAGRGSQFAARAPPV